MLHKKKILAVIIMAAILTATSCSTQNGNGTTTNSQETSNEVTKVTKTEEITTAEEKVALSEDTTVESVSTTVSETTAEEVVDTVYTLDGKITKKMQALSELYIGNRGRLAKVLDKAKNGGEVTIGYIGGSITAGSSAGEADCYSRLVTNWFETTFPKAKINYLHKGIGATGSYIGVHRADSDIVSQKPDLVFVEFSVNDTIDNTERNTAAYDGLLQKIWFAESKPAIITIGMTMEDGTSFQDYHAEIVKAYDLPMISYKNAILDVISKDYIKWKDISDDNIHPNVKGHSVLAELITAYLDKTLAEIDTIPDTESDFSSPISGKYRNAVFLEPTDPSITLNGFDLKASEFGGFKDYYLAKAKDGHFPQDTKIAFEVEASSIGILYGRFTAAGGSFDVYADGEKKATVDCTFPGGWGNYVEATEVITFDTVGKHKIEIVPIDNDDTSKMLISRIAIS